MMEAACIVSPSPPVYQRCPANHSVTSLLLLLLHPPPPHRRSPSLARHSANSLSRTGSLLSQGHDLINTSGLMSFPRPGS